MKKKGDLARQIIADKDRQIATLTQAHSQPPVGSQHTDRQKRGMLTYQLFTHIHIYT